MPTPMSAVKLRPDAVAWRLVQDEVVALDLRQSEYLTFNDTGQVLWQALAQGTNPVDLVIQLLERFDVDEATASADVAAFLAGLRARGLLAESDATA